MKYLFLLLIVSPTLTFASVTDLQEKLYTTMQQHQATEIGDDQFDETVRGYKHDPEWGEEQNLFLNDYIASLPEKKRTQLASLVSEPAINVVENAGEEIPEKEKPTSEISQGGSWKKWALGALGAALFFTPYKLVFYVL